MKYYTKEWYELMQKQQYTAGLQKIPDKTYSEQEIQAFYDADLAAEVKRDEELYHTPPNFDAYEAFSKRPPFDPAETVKCFENCYKGRVRYGGYGYPRWVCDTVDQRLLALHRIPESAYDRLRREEAENQKVFRRIMSEAEKDLDAQGIPERIKTQFCFHDACVLALKKNRADMELYLRKDGGWPEGTTPYIKIIFKKTTNIEREKGFSIRIKTNAEGELISSCQYLYDELYRTNEGYEFHVLLSTPKSLRYLTICCEDIIFVDNIEDRTIG